MMHKPLSDDEHKKPSTDADKQLLFSRQELSRVYIDDDGHVIAVFQDDNEMDITELFNVVKQA